MMKSEETVVIVPEAVLATCCVTVLLLIALGLWKGSKHRNKIEEGSCCGCCYSIEEGPDTPVYENETLLSSNSVAQTKANPSRVQEVVNPLSIDHYYSSVPFDGSDNNLNTSYSIVRDSECLPVTYKFPLQNNIQKEGASDKDTFRERSLDDHSYSSVPYDDSKQLVYENTEPRNGYSSQRGVYEECGAQGQLQVDSQTSKEGKSTENHLYSYACVARQDLSGDDYTEPAEDEHSLYAQFKALHVKLVKRDVIGLGDYLGSGQFGVVYEGEWSQGDQKTTVAIKTLNSNSHDNDKVRFLQEAVIMGQFKHPNVITMHGLVIEEEPFMIILELFPRGDLRKHLISMRSRGGVDSDLPPVLLQCCREISYGMCYLSKIGFVHRDLAARNILVTEDGTCKVADFGMSRDLAHEDYYISHGGQIPVKWTAPEALHFRKYSTSSDVWSFGVVMYEIWSLGHKPFEGHINTEVIKLIDKGVRLAPPPGCPRAIYSFMIKCWNPASSGRPSFQDSVKYLLSSEDELLKWSVRDKAVHLSACQLGAELSVAVKLHKDLRELYT